MQSPELQDYYRELILDHSRRPRNRGCLSGVTHTGVCRHPDRGDSMSVHVSCMDGVLESITFEGEGSAVALASASLMTLRVQGLTVDEARGWIAGMKTMLHASMEDEPDFDVLGDLAALGGIRQFPARIACALLAWEALEDALKSV